MTSECLTHNLFDDGYRGDLDPFVLFDLWLEQAKQKEVNDANAMALASVDENGLPDIRMVLLNGRPPEGFVFYTNRDSAKGRQLAANPRAAILFHWKSLRRQVRVRGEVREVAGELADAYFASRPRGSQIGAHVSLQSRPLTSRAELMARNEALSEKFSQKQVPRPACWTGYCLFPASFEFWQDGDYRLHDRVRFTQEENTWTRQRLNP